MRNIQRRRALCLIPSLIFLGVQPLLAAEMSGRELLEKSAAAYGALESYAGTTVVISVFAMGEEKLAQTSSAKIQFSRSKLPIAGLNTKRLEDALQLKPKIRIDGLDTQGGKFAIVGGSKTWQSTKALKDGAWEEAQSLELAVAAMTGIAMHAPTLVPAALLKLNWGYPFTQIENAELEGRDRIDNADCYRVVSDTYLSKRTFWVDSQNFLLRQMKDERDEDHMANMMSRAPKLPKVEQEKMDAARAGIAKIKSMMLLHVFAISSVDKPIDEAVFEDPTQVKPAAR